MQLKLPVVLVKVPASQSEHSEDVLAAANVPAGQDSHFVLLALLVLPASQAVQELLPLSEEMRPLGQDTQ